MGHAKEIITMDVYGDKKGIIADCVDEIQPFIDEVLGLDRELEVLSDGEPDYVIDAEEFFDRN